MDDFVFEKGKFVEQELENAFIELFQQQGYTYVCGEDIHRLFSETILSEDLITYLIASYPTLTETEVERAVSILKNTPSTPLYEGNRATYQLIVDGFDLKRDDPSQLPVHIQFIDFDNIDNNSFKVVNQFSVEDYGNRRPDLLVFVNGIPIAIFEFKTAIEEDKTVFDAWEQITIRYARDIPSLLKYTGMSVISDGANTKLGTIFTPYRFYYSWNKVNEDEKAVNGISSLFTMIKGVFAKDRLLKIYRDFIYYPDESKDSEAIICRYPQFFAAEKMLQSLETHKRPNGDGKGGIYFGATGCGKTYTMLFLSRLLMLRRNEVFSNPTIVLIVDREDLDSQTSKIFVKATTYLHDKEVRSIETRQDLHDALADRPSGGVYITTIQKFCDATGLLSNRSNIICISDEAHRSQSGVTAKLKKTDKGVFTTYGFAHYLRESFPNAVYCGFTGTPIDEALAVFGRVVDRYTMKQACDDGITVRISYEPRLARVALSPDDIKKIEAYYKACAEQGSTEEQIEESEKAMSAMEVILGHPDRLKKLAADIVEHYETLCSEKPKIVQKAMVVCSDRKIAFALYNEIVALREDWTVKRKAEDESKFTQEELDGMAEVAKINLVATQGENDDPKLYAACGDKTWRSFLSEQFKDDKSNFQIAIVVDMWITGFDVPSLAVMYIDKPLQRHSLIQTISRVNRVYDGKDKGIIVDYIGIKTRMMEAVKKYGDGDESPVDELSITIDIFRNHLKLIGDLMTGFDAKKFFTGSPLERLVCLNNGAEYVQLSKEVEKRFMALSRTLKAAYEIAAPSGELTDAELNYAQFYLAIRSIIYKQTIGDAPDTEAMNEVVTKMVQEAITCTGIENIVGESKSTTLFDDSFLQQLNEVKLPITKFNALLKLLKKAIADYGKVNKVKSVEFGERLQRVVDDYNSRDKLTFTSEVVEDFVNDLTDKLVQIFNDLETDKTSFEKLGITYEEKAFYDILVRVRDDHGFKFEDEKCIDLAKKIKQLIDDKAQYADFFTRTDIRSQLSLDLTVLLYKNGYPPEWDEEVFDKVMQQAENFKKYSE